MSSRATVARIWRGRTRRELADAYEPYIRREGIPPLEAKPLGVQLFREDREDETEFVAISYWADADSMASFTGGDPYQVHHLPRDAEFLIELPKRVAVLRIHSRSLSAERPKAIQCERHCRLFPPTHDWRDDGDGGSQPWGAEMRNPQQAWIAERKISSDPEWKYVNLRRYFAYVEHSIEQGTQWVVFEPNGEALWANVRRTVEDFLLAEWQTGALVGDRPERAYFVKCDRSTMSQSDLDDGRLVCLVGVAPLRPAEFIILRIGQWTADRRAGAGSATFEARRNPYGNFNFLVDFGEVSAGFEEVSGLGIENTASNLHAAGSKQRRVRKVPGIHKSSDVTLKRGIIGGLSLYSWLDRIGGKGREPLHQVMIRQQNKGRTEVVQSWQLIRARIIKHTSGPMNAKGADVAMEELVLAYERLELERTNNDGDHDRDSDSHRARGRARVLGAQTWAGSEMAGAVTVYGIKNCDTMKKARAWLDARGIAYDFHDYKTMGVDRGRLDKWTRTLGWENLLNRAGTTFRKLPDKDKQALTEKKAIALMLDQPSMIKRPVVEIGGRFLVGFDAKQYQEAFKGTTAK